MSQTSRASNANTPIPSRSAPSLLGALLLGGSLLVAACATGANTSAPAASPTTAAPHPSLAIAGGLQNDFVNVVAHVNPSVVVIETNVGLGSGIVFDANGDIVTNNHVVTGSTKFTVTLADGQTLPGTLVGSYPAGDLAVIHVTATNLKPATFGDSSKLVVGDIVLAVGNPLGLQSSVTQGIVSALGRNVPESSTVTLPNVIQTSAEINPGNSGGALVDLAGEVIGIPTLTALDPQLGNTAAAGIGFAIPSNDVVDVAGQLIANGHVVNPPVAPSASPAAS
jgi:putative serine protease PepD